jgi:ABC-2 type transport system permease protein
MSAVVNGVIQRFLDQVNLELVQAPSLLRLEGQGILATQPDYFDFLLPGLLGMGVMVYSIIGVASVMALYREKKILKRILATPLRVRTFFAALIIAYLLLSLVQAAVILTAGVVLFGGQVLGNLLHIGIIVLMANAVFLNIGFIVGSFSKTVPAASGLGNAVAMPMMFLSGTFFPKDGLPDALAAAVEFLPLSPMLDALRGVALEARPLWDFPLELALLGGWLVVTAMAAIRLTRFS